MRHAVRCAALLMVLMPAVASRPVAAAGATDIVLHAVDGRIVGPQWQLVTDASAASGARLSNINHNAAKRETAAAAPASYVDFTFTPVAGAAYRVWIRAKADSNSFNNDSLFLQFSGAVYANGVALARIGTGNSLGFVLENCSGSGEAGWGWEDTMYCGDDVPVHFASSSAQTLRIQQREDGISIDQIVLSPVTYLAKSPGAAKNDSRILARSSATTTPPPASSTAPGKATDIVLHSIDARVVGSQWQLVTDSTAASGARVWNPQKGTAKRATAAASPASYAEFTFTPVAGMPYRLWIRAKADSNNYQNDSVFLQFSGSATSAGKALGRTGTANAEDVSLQDCNGAALASWGWQDTGWCGNASPITFASSSAQTIRFQQREDGVSIDQIVLSPSTYLTKAPGALRSDTKILARTSTTAGAKPTAPAAPTQPATPPKPPATPPPPPATTGAATLRVLQWNIHHGGFGTDGKYDPNRVATWMAKMAPDVIMVNEIEKLTGWGNQDQPEVYKSLLQAKTGKTWYYVFAQEFGQWTANGKGNIIFSSVPFTFTDRYALVHNHDRTIAEASINWHGRTITLISTHLDPDSQPLRLAQATEITTFASAEPETRIICGDMNAWPDQSSIAQFAKSYNDSWAVAKANGTATAFAGNSGETKSGRIDYIWYSKNSTTLTVKSSQVIDTRDAKGVTPSDHRPVMTVFNVK